MTQTLNTTEITAPRKPDGTLVKQTDNLTFVMEVFFNHNSKETFQDKLLKVIFAEDTGGFANADN